MGTVEVTNKESGDTVCELAYTSKHSLSDIRKMIKLKTGLKDFVFVYPDNIRIHRKQEKNLKISSFNGQIDLLILARSTTGNLPLHEHRRACRVMNPRRVALSGLGPCRLTSRSSCSSFSECQLSGTPCLSQQHRYGTEGTNTRHLCSRTWVRS